jgi:hypothetical protein
MLSVCHPAAGSLQLPLHGRKGSVLAMGIAEQLVDALTQHRPLLFSSALHLMHLHFQTPIHHITPRHCSNKSRHKTKSISRSPGLQLEVSQDAGQPKSKKWLIVAAFQAHALRALHTPKKSVASTLRRNNHKSRWAPRGNLGKLRPTTSLDKATFNQQDCAKLCVSMVSISCLNFLNTDARRSNPAFSLGSIAAIPCVREKTLQP